MYTSIGSASKIGMDVSTSEDYSKPTINELQIS